MTKPRNPRAPRTSRAAPAPADDGGPRTVLTTRPGTIGPYGYIAGLLIDSGRRGSTFSAHILAQSGGRTRVGCSTFSGSSSAYTDVLPVPLLCHGFRPLGRGRNGLRQLLDMRGPIERRQCIAIQ